MTETQQKIDELIKRIDALQISINTLTAIVTSRLPNPYLPEPSMPMWPWPQRMPCYPPYHITSESNAQGE